MKIVSILLLVLFVFSAHLKAQKNGHQNPILQPRATIEEDLATIASGGIYTRTFDNRYIGVRGTPYLTSDYVLGGLYLTSGKFYNNIKLKLDAYNDDLLYKTKKDEEILLNKSLIDYFILSPTEDSIRKFKLLHTPDFPLGVYYEVLYDKKSSFLVKHEKLLVKADYQKAINTNRTYDEFKDQQYYFVMRTGESEPSKVRLTKKAALDYLGNDHRLSDYIKTHRLSMRFPKDWIDLLEYYDSGMK